MRPVCVSKWLFVLFSACLGLWVLPLALSAIAALFDGWNPGAKDDEGLLVLAIVLASIALLAIPVRALVAAFRRSDVATRKVIATACALSATAYAASLWVIPVASHSGLRAEPASHCHPILDALGHVH